MKTLLTRDEFRTSVYERDKHTCINCKVKNVKLDAHHILDRKLFDDGGYYLDNGVSLCEPCHILAETMRLTCGELREKAGITEIILPPQLSPGRTYDKWGKPIEERQKYPRTYHLPSSPGLQNDDRLLETTDVWLGKEVVITEKMDGENTSIYSDYLHPRSTEYSYHPSRTFVKSIQGTIGHMIPEGWRVCGENVTAVHSIEYDTLESYFYMFSIWDDKNFCLSWDETEMWAEELGIPLVPILYRGEWQGDDTISQLHIDVKRQEGYVVRPTDSFHYDDFLRLVGKWVRKDHVAVNAEHWRTAPVKYNRLKHE
jgi:hypothetical protein